VPGPSLCKGLNSFPGGIYIFVTYKRDDSGTDDQMSLKGLWQFNLNSKRKVDGPHCGGRSGRNKERGPRVGGLVLIHRRKKLVLPERSFF
jgi:hypothetical protein